MFIFLKSLVIVFFLSMLSFGYANAFTYDLCNKWVYMPMENGIGTILPYKVDNCTVSKNDSDGDGISNSDEGISGTNPLDPNDPISEGNLDLDGDGIVNGIDVDIDGDGVPNITDVFPRDSAETMDSDYDGVGDNEDTPSAYTQNMTINEDSFTNPIVLGGHDNDGEMLTYRIQTYPTHGTLSGIAPNLTYTPNKDYFGDDTLNFKVSDATHTSANATIYITITNVPEHNGQTALPFPQHIDYGANTILPNQYSQIRMDNDVKSFYTQWKNEYLVDEGIHNGHKLYRIALGKAGNNHNKTVSEGQGYGMMISVLMAGYDNEAKTIFDGLWYFSRLHPSGIDIDLMTWQVPIGSSGNDSAFDGDTDIAYALLMANKQWGSNGSIDYVREASTVIKAIESSTIGKDSKLPMLGDWVDSNGGTYNQYTNRPSDFMPSHFQVFAQFSHDTNWIDIADTSRQTAAYLQLNYSATTGLLPDFIKHTLVNGTLQPNPSTPNLLEGPNDGKYYYNACRVPLRYGMDALFYHNSTSRQVVINMSNWITRNYPNPTDIQSGYSLDGTVLNGSDYFSTVFAAPMGVATMNVPSQQNWLNQLYNAVKDTHEDYYEDSVNLLSLLIMTGNFWYPTY